MWTGSSTTLPIIISCFRLTLISDNLVWPNGLAIDRPAGRLYWNDGQRKIIESSDLSGRGRRVVVTSVPHPYGLVIVGIHMYWTDWQTYALHRADKINGTDNIIIRGRLDGLMDVRSVQVRPTKTGSRYVTNTVCFQFNAYTNFWKYTITSEGALSKIVKKINILQQGEFYLSSHLHVESLTN